MIAQHMILNLVTWYYLSPKIFMVLKVSPNTIVSAYCWEKGNHRKGYSKGNRVIWSMW